MNWFFSSLPFWVQGSQCLLASQAARAPQLSSVVNWSTQRIWSEHSKHLHQSTCRLASLTDGLPSNSSLVIVGQEEEEETIPEPREDSNFSSESLAWPTWCEVCDLIVLETEKIVVTVLDLTTAWVWLLRSGGGGAGHQAEGVEGEGRELAVPHQSHQPTGPGPTQALAELPRCRPGELDVVLVGEVVAVVLLSGHGSIFFQQILI